MKLSVRTRLTLGNVGLLALALLAFGGATRFVIGRVLWGRLDEMLVQQAQNDASRQRQQGPSGPMGMGFEGPPRGFGGPPPGAPRPRPGELGLLLRPRHWSFDNNNTNDEAPWSTESLGEAKRVKPVFGRGEEDGQALRTYTLPMKDPEGNLHGAVQTAIPTGPTEAALASVTYSLVLLLPVLCLVAGLGGLWLTSQALAPIRQLTEAASHIEAENLAERLPEPGGGDELDQLTKMLNRSLGRLDDAFTRQKQFTAHASHELRTPLATIKTALGLLRHPDIPPALRDEAIASADDATDRANRLIGDLLFLARSQNGALPVRRASLKLAETLRTVVPAPASLEISPTLTFVTDRDLLLRLVSNLVSNALRHTPPEGKVAVHATRNGDILTLTVTDTGAGIAPEHLEKLGQPFYRPDTARTRDDGGIGLGLSLCHAIAAALGGTLTLQSELGKGTTATVTLG
ncbi:ATP-binding protein [Armatimonas sp.]|uniref:HAMP domain-containing sensor histidine kinase n=1 Tax=Armatimonas sp. TaxID=1872638 RepID=UPI00286A9DEC|nr:ATP-binding protein [Armatimonas sp.]